MQTNRAATKCPATARLRTPKIRPAAAAVTGKAEGSQDYIEDLDSRRTSSPLCAPTGLNLYQKVIFFFRISK